ncbi:tyrosine-type recombinase/integrase [Nocardia sp. NPDC001965]
MADTVQIYLATLTVRNTHEAYGVARDQLLVDSGADTDVALLNRVGGWFTFVRESRSATTFNIRLIALASACGYRREQGWLADDPLVRLRVKPAQPDTAKSLRGIWSRRFSDRMCRCEPVLGPLLSGSSARAEAVLMEDVPDLETANRWAVVSGKGGARKVIACQTGAAELLPRTLAGRRSGPLFLTDRKARLSVAAAGVDLAAHRARLSYRRAAELLENQIALFGGGPYTFHRLRHSRQGGYVVEDGASTPMLMKLSGHISVRSLVRSARVYDEDLRRYQAGSDPAARRRRSRQWVLCRVPSGTVDDG